MAQRIVPTIWYAGTAGEAADFYRRVVPNSRVVGSSTYPLEGLADFQRDLAGELRTVDVEIGGLRTTLINAGDEYRPNASISYMVNFDPLLWDGDETATRSALDTLWDALSDGGEVMMPLGEYPFSARYGWVADRWGMTWQLILTDPAGDPRPFVMPSFLFCDRAQNRAAEAIRRWTDVFDDSRTGVSVPYAEPSGPAVAGSVMFADFMLAGQWFVAMDAAVETAAPFTPAVSFQVACDGQAEIDRYWAALSRVPADERCGWCTDEFGVSWQIVPSNLEELLARPGAWEHLMAMTKPEIDAF